MSIIIPTFNAEKTLQKCLSAIFGSMYRNFEVLIVDDASQDDSLRIAKSFPCRIVKMLYHRGASAARNKGAKYAKGEVLLFIDSDIVIENNTLNLFIDSLKDYPAVFGIYYQKSGSDNLLSLYQNYYAHKSIHETKALTNMFYSYCAAIRKDIFEEVGGFDESWVRATFEDVEFGLRVSAKGYTIYLNKNIMVMHYNNFTLKKFIKNYFYKSLDLSKFMFKKQKLTLNNEGWTNYKNIASFVSGVSIIPFCLLSLWYPLFTMPLLFCAIIFLVMNLDFYKFILREKPSGLVFALILNFMVQIVSALGMMAGFASYWKGKDIACS